MSTPRRERFIINCPERLRRALLVRAARKGLRPAEMAQMLLEAALEEELAVVDEEMEGEVPPPPSPRGRKPKRPD